MRRRQAPNQRLCRENVELSRKELFVIQKYFTTNIFVCKNPNTAISGHGHEKVPSRSCARSLLLYGTVRVGACV